MSQFLKIGAAQAKSERPLIAVSMLPANDSAFNEQIEQFNASQADVVEWRIDAWYDMRALMDSFKDYLSQIKKPVIITYRTKSEGGYGNDDMQMYYSLYQIALDQGVAAIDIEAHLFPQYQKLAALAKNAGTTVIVSKHILNHSEVNFENQLLALAQLQMDVIKLAVRPVSPIEVTNLLQATQVVSRQIEQPIITMAMGDLGQSTRKIGYQYGSQLTFASLFEASAAGQLSLSEMLNYFS